MYHNEMKLATFFYRQRFIFTSACKETLITPQAFTCRFGNILNAIEINMGDNAIRNVQKSKRKQRRAYHRLLTDMNIKCCDDATEYLLICNVGLVTGLQLETLQQILDEIISKYSIVMVPGKSYCFVQCICKEDAMVVYNKIHGCRVLTGDKTPLYLCYCESVPNMSSGVDNTVLPPGCELIKEFITKEDEEMLLQTIDWKAEETDLSSMKHRKVRHFGYEFRYTDNKVDPDHPIAPIPRDYEFLQNLFEKHGCGNYTYDQLTINHYSPGQGIPPHIDTHSVFEDTILSLSLGSSYIMDFKRNDTRVSILLPSRSLLIMSGEGRYAWSHGISPRFSDVVQTENGITSQQRGTRVSFTFRKVRRGDCICNFPEHCDSYKDTIATVDHKTAVSLEDAYVHKVYEQISNHFNKTRRQQWPNVTKFLENLDNSSIVLDVGCGNGKYLKGDDHIFKIGCDRSGGLAEICKEKEFEVLICDCLYLPYKDNCADAAISIAVFHHISTTERRKRAISEIVRVLRPNGKCLIYVWAKEQNWNSVESTYLRYNTSKDKKVEANNMYKSVDHNVMLPIHKNRTEFTHSDMLVPWKRKDGGNFLRYYHVFAEGELQKLCSEIPFVAVNDVYYDQGNWCIILHKCEK